MLAKLLTFLFGWIISLHRVTGSHERVHSQRVHFWVIVIIFIGLGCFVGVWAVLLADLAHALKLTPAALGIALTSFSSAGIVMLVFGGFSADRFGRRPILLLGVGGLGLLFVSLVFVSSYSTLLFTLLFGGICASCYDLAVNTIGGDYERRYASKAMTLFHAGFSGGAALGATGSAVALAYGIGFRTIYMTVGILFLLLAVVVLWLPLPSSTPTTKSVEIEMTNRSMSPASVLALLLTPVVLSATLLVSMSFLTDGALEGYTSIYLRNVLESGALLGGVGIAIYHLIGMIGRLSSTAALRRFGDRRIITAAGMLSVLGMALALSTTSAPLAVSGFLLVGLGQSPIAPTAFSLAAQAGAHRAARAVSIVTTFGYTAFLISPLLTGVLANRFSLRAALLFTIATSIGIVLVAQRLPGSRHTSQPE